MYSRGGVLVEPLEAIRFLFFFVFVVGNISSCGVAAPF